MYDTKYCRKCSKFKTFDCFYKTSKTTDEPKYVAYCKECWKSNNKKYQKTHTDKCTYFNLDKELQDALMADMQEYIKYKQQRLPPPLSIYKLATKHNVNRNVLQSWYIRGVFSKESD